MTCYAKHTKYQPTEAEFVCPRCHAKAGVFCISESATGADETCALLHDNDVLGCMSNDHDCKKDREYLSGKTFAARIQKAKNLVPCVHCKGTGLVKKDGEHE